MLRNKTIHCCKQIIVLKMEHVTRVMKMTDMKVITCCSHLLFDNDIIRKQSCSQCVEKYFVCLLKSKLIMIMLILF